MAAIGKRFRAEQIANMLWEIEVMTANGKSLLEACKLVGISDICQSYIRFCKGWQRRLGS